MLAYSKSNQVFKKIILPYKVYALEILGLVWRLRDTKAKKRSQKSGSSI